MAKKRNGNRKVKSKNNTQKKTLQITNEESNSIEQFQVNDAQERKSRLQKLHQDYGFTGAIISIVGVLITGVIVLYVNGKLPFFYTEKAPKTDGEIIDQSNRTAVENNYIINNKTVNKTTNIQKNQSVQNNTELNEELFEVYIRNDTDDGVSYQFYDYEMKSWIVSTVQTGEEQRILSVEPRVLFGLQDNTGNTYIFNTSKISGTDANIKTNKILYNIKKVNLTSSPSSVAKNYIDEVDFVWKVFLNNKEILPEPSLNILNNENIIFEP